MAAKKSSNGTKVTKSGFIRALSDKTPAKEVVAKAKEAGLELNEKFVWTVQSEMRAKAKGAKPDASSNASQTSSAATKSATKAKKAKKRKKKSKAAKPGAVAASALKPVTRTPSAASTAEHKMRALVVELGTARAEEVYRAVKSQLDALVGGA